MSSLDSATEQYIEHEVKIRVLEAKHDEIYREFGKIADMFKKIDHGFELTDKLIDRKFELLDAKIESRTMLIVGLIITSIILPVVLHYLKLV